VNCTAPRQNTRLARPECGHWAVSVGAVQFTQILIMIMMPLGAQLMKVFTSRRQFIAPRGGYGLARRP